MRCPSWETRPRVGRSGTRYVASCLCTPARIWRGRATEKLLVESCPGRTVGRLATVRESFDALVSPVADHLTVPPGQRFSLPNIQATDICDYLMLEGLLFDAGEHPVSRDPADPDGGVPGARGLTVSGEVAGLIQAQGPGDSLALFRGGAAKQGEGADWARGDAEVDRVGDLMEHLPPHVRRNVATRLLESP